MGFGVEAFVESNNVLVASTFQNIVLLHDLLQRTFISHVRFIDGFEGDEFAGEPINSQIDLTKGSLSNDFTNLVVIYFRIVTLICDVQKDVVQNEFAGRELATISRRLSNDPWRLLIFRPLVWRH